MIKRALLIGIVLAFSIFLLWKKALKEPACNSFTNTLIVGTNAEYPPFAFMEKDSIVGFDIDLIKEIAERLDKKIEFKDMPFDALLPAAQTGAIQIIAAGMSPTPERAKTVLFTKPYISNDPLTIITPVSHSIDIKNLDDLIGKKVIVNEGFALDFHLSKIPNISLIRLPTVADAFLALKVGQADAFAIAQSCAQPFFNQYPAHQFKCTAIDTLGDSYALIISPKHADLLSSIQKALDSMIQDGTIARLKEKWNLS
jgi:ABC-type amino acid transport substrate-binding protein